MAGQYPICCTTPITSWPGWARSWLPLWALALLFLWRGRLYRSHWLLWIILLTPRFLTSRRRQAGLRPNLAAQPWLVYGLLRTAEGASPLVHSGNALFTLLGFLGLYLLLGLLFLFLLGETITTRPRTDVPGPQNTERAAH